MSLILIIKGVRTERCHFEIQGQNSFQRENCTLENKTMSWTFGHEKMGPTSWKEEKKEEILLEEGENLEEVETTIGSKTIAKGQ